MKGGTSCLTATGDRSGATEVGGRPTGRQLRPSHCWAGALRTGCCVHACTGRRRLPTVDPEGSAAVGLREVEAESLGLAGFRGPAYGQSPRGATALSEGPPLASDEPAVRCAGCAPAGRPPLRSRGQAESTAPGLPDVARSCPGLRGRRVAATPLLFVRHRVSSDGITVVVCATSAPPRGDDTGRFFRTDLRAPWPGCVLTDLNTPRRSRRGGRPAQRPARGRSRCSEVSTHRRYRARVELLPLHQRRAPAVHMVEHVAVTLASIQRSPFVARGCSRAPGPKPWRRVTRRRPEDGRHGLHRVVTDAMGSASPACTPRTCARETRTRRLHPTHRRPSGGRPARGRPSTGLPRGTGRARIDLLHPIGGCHRHGRR